VKAKGKIRHQNKRNCSRDVEENRESIFLSDDEKACQYLIAGILLMSLFHV